MVRPVTGHRGPEQPRGPEPTKLSKNLITSRAHTQHVAKEIVFTHNKPTDADISKNVPNKAKARVATHAAISTMWKGVSR